jgi:hypothetical protein
LAYRLRWVRLRGSKPSVAKNHPGAGISCKTGDRLMLFDSRVEGAEERKT